MKKVIRIFIFLFLLFISSKGFTQNTILKKGNFGIGGNIGGGAFTGLYAKYFVKNTISINLQILPPLKLEDYEGLINSTFLIGQFYLRRDKSYTPFFYTGAGVYSYNAPEKFYYQAIYGGGVSLFFENDLEFMFSLGQAFIFGGEEIEAKTLIPGITVLVYLGKKNINEE